MLKKVVVVSSLVLVTSCASEVKGTPESTSEETKQFLAEHVVDTCVFLSTKSLSLPNERTKMYFSKSTRDEVLQTLSSSRAMLSDPLLVKDKMKKILLKREMPWMSSCVVVMTKFISRHINRGRKVSEFIKRVDYNYEVLLEKVARKKAVLAPSKINI